MKATFQLLVHRTSARMSRDRLPVSRGQEVLLCSVSDGVWPGALSKGTAVQVK